MSYYGDSIIYNELPLTEAFIPTRLLHREGQLRELERCLRPALYNKSIENVFLVGPSGTGKTTVARWVLESYFKDVSAYVNCWKYSSTHEVLKEILLSFQIPVHGREPTSELIKQLENLVKKKRIIVCLDEVDHLENFDILYILSRNNVGLILASTCYHALIDLPSRIKSSLALTEIEFPAYTHEELFDILKDRINFSFKPGSIKDELIRIASVAAEGDARVGLEILRRAGKKAEDKGLKQVTIEEIKQAIKEARKTKFSFLTSKLNEHQKVILEILGKRKVIPSGLLYKEYCKFVNKPVVDRAYRNYMNEMVKLGLVKSEGEGQWKKYILTLQ
ncbi:MAG: AAA family ATPase [Candidatus Bathyarchaeia archaeon]